ncbi:MAG TPA: hypothetical protein VD902_08080 [Symbiobacteriaceae bacterium]|nr:hypothetical protein [Symbiobacteriaceae bacterium]
MSDDADKGFKAQQNQEPVTIDTTMTGNHPAGNYIRSEEAVAETMPPLQAASIWIEQRDHAKQGMARKFDMRNATASPGRPHVGHVPGSGEIQ